MTGQDWADDKAQLLLTLSAGQRGAKALRAELIACALRYERANGLAALRLAHEHEQAAVERARAEERRAIELETLNAYADPNNPHFLEGLQSIIDRLRDPNETMVEAVADAIWPDDEDLAETPWRERMKIALRALADVLSAPPATERE